MGHRSKFLAMYFNSLHDFPRSLYPSSPALCHVVLARINCCYCGIAAFLQKASNSPTSWKVFHFQERMMTQRVSSELSFCVVNLIKNIKMVNDEVTFLFLTELFKGSHYKVRKSSSNLNLFNKISLVYYSNEIPQRRTKLQTHLFDLF